MPGALSMLGLGPGSSKGDAVGASKPPAVPSRLTDDAPEQEDAPPEVSDEELIAAQDVLKALRGGGKNPAQALALALRAFTRMSLDDGAPADEG